MTAMEYAGRTAVVTGAGSGLGAAMADKFAAAGAQLVLLDIDAARVEAKAAELRAKGADAVSARVDVADPESLAAAARMARSTFGSCEVLCANVGVQQFGAVDRLTRQDWEWVLSVNVMGVIETVSAFLPLLREGRGDRHVVLTSSASFFQPGVRLSAYVASKYAVTGYGEVLRRELAGEGINVSLLFPAGMMTRHLESSVLARPKALGESRLDRADVEAMRSDAVLSQEADVTTADNAIRNLLADLRAKQPYIFTHGGYRRQIEQRNQAILEAFDRMLAN